LAEVSYLFVQKFKGAVEPGLLAFLALFLGGGFFYYFNLYQSVINFMLDREKNVMLYFSK